MKIYTSRYGNKEIARTGLVPVGISLRSPRFKTAFKIAARIKELAPTRDMLQMEYTPYKELYFKMLDTIGIGELQDCFKKISSGQTIRNQKSLAQTAGRIAPGQAETRNENDLVLLCFEDLTKEGEWCHRRMFASWWREKTGQTILEL